MSDSEDVQEPRGPNELTTTENKRKRSFAGPEIEVDINLPEPPSKKAKRKEKKASTKKSKPSTTDPTPKSLLAEGNDIDNAQNGASFAPSRATGQPNSNGAQHSPTASAPQKGEHGIWIGNLPFTATRDRLRTFFLDHGGIEEKDMVRLHLPRPSKGGDRRQAEQQNRGFAYVDFASKELAEKAITLSEKLIDGRRVLIKDAKNFEGRPAEAKNSKGDDEKVGENGTKKEPTKRVFVGNLGFDVTKDDLRELFAPAGEVVDVFLATFEDSGKCKGYGWVTFGTVDAARFAVKGYLFRFAPAENDVAAEGDEDESDEDDVEIVMDKQPKPNKAKTWVNQLHGRKLRCEFAEDAQTRYKKRYSREAFEARRASAGHGNDETSAGTAENGAAWDGLQVLQSFPGQVAAARETRSKPQLKQGKEERREERRKRHDARTIAPGKALASTQRATGAIVAGSGTKVTFD